MKANKRLDKANIAKNLYLTGQFSQKEIATLFNVSEQTVVNWKKKGEWDKAMGRIADLAVTRLQVVYNLTKKALTASNLEGDKFSFDDMAKAAAAIEKFMPKKMSTGDVMQFSENFLFFLMRQGKEEMAQMFAEEFKDYVAQLTGAKDA